MINYAPRVRISNGEYHTMSRILELESLRTRLPDIRAGEAYELTGFVYTARDAAHKRITACIDSGAPLPFDIKDSIIYYAGPTPAMPGRVIGSCGPTTSGRMDPYTPRLLSLGLVGMIGKGERSPQVREAIQKYHAVYFCAIGGAGALASKAVRSMEEIAFPELGCESVKRLYIESFPVIVAVDMYGGNLFVSGRAQYARESAYIKENTENQ